MAATQHRGTPVSQVVEKPTAKSAVPWVRKFEPRQHGSFSKRKSPEMLGFPVVSLQLPIKRGSTILRTHKVPRAAASVHRRLAHAQDLAEVLGNAWPSVEHGFGCIHLFGPAPPNQCFLDGNKQLWGGAASCDLSNFNF